MGCEELPNGTRFAATCRDGRVTLELSVPLDVLRFLAGTGDTDAAVAGGGLEAG